MMNAGAAIPLITHHSAFRRRDACATRERACAERSEGSGESNAIKSAIGHLVNEFKNKYYLLSRKSIGIDDVVSFPENRVVANEFVVDIEERLRTLSSQLVEGIEQAWRDREIGLGVGALYRFQGGLVRIEDDTA